MTFPNGSDRPLFFAPLPLARRCVRGVHPGLPFAALLLLAALPQPASPAERRGALPLDVGNDSSPVRCLSTAPSDETPPTHRAVVEHRALRMPDGVQLAMTLYRPVARTPGERFPALLELLPYRKDDSFYARDYPLHLYFACRGFLSARVDVRGTGGSGGTVPSREYSNEEVQDASEIIAQLAARADANGAVGMWGISWGGFNAIQVAMRHPPALRAILAVHASDDLYGDDVRYLDGALHFDPYALQIDHENALPRSPDYPLDSAYFADRFDQRPWLFTYLEHPLDGPFWREGSLRFHPERLTIPAYLIGGLADGYRDTPLRVLATASAPVKVEIGPWAHAWPDNGAPGPNYEWRARAVRWWRHWLQGEDSGLMREPAVLLFVRDSVAPGTSTEVAGAFRFVRWPPDPGKDVVFRTEGRTLATHAGPARFDTLRHVAGGGSAAGLWWGDVTGDMREDDRDALTYDSAPLRTPLQLAGFPRVHLRARSAMPRAHWSVRLEDVFPDGRVALVTARVVNSALSADRTALAPPDAGRWLDSTLALHFTTWTFRPGHRIRLSIAHAQFPMVWPSPFPGRSVVQSGLGGLELALSPVETLGAPPSLPSPTPRDRRRDVTSILDEATPGRLERDPTNGTVRYRLGSRSAYRLGGTRIAYEEAVHYRADPRTPALAGWRASAQHEIRSGGRQLQLGTTIDVRSTADSLHVSVRRTLGRNGRTIRSRTWTEAYPRTAH